jgi:hypothetical protein
MRVAEAVAAKKRTRSNTRKATVKRLKPVPNKSRTEVVGKPVLKVLTSATSH